MILQIVSIREKLLFSTLARMYSEDPGSARRGGEYGFTGRGELTLEFANVVFNLTDPKKISKVFETEYGYHIAQLIEKRGDRVSYRHILIKPRVDEKEIEAELNKLDTLANDIRKGKVTFDEAATWVSQDKDTRNNHGLLANPQTSTSRFEMQQPGWLDFSGSSKDRRGNADWRSIQTFYND